MGLFKKKKSFKELAIESYKAKTLQELTMMIGGGLRDKTEPKSIDERFWLANVYLEKLIGTDVSLGGFGFQDVSLALHIMSLCDAFAGSVYEYGTYKRKSEVYGEVIQNYRLEFLKNYLFSGNRKPIPRDWFRLIFNAFDDTLNEETDDETWILTKEHIQNPQCPLYNSWVYQGEDNDFIIYKIKVAILLCSGNFVEKYGLFKRGADGKPLDVTREYLTIEDLTKFNNQYELENFINDCQTIDAD